MAESIASKRGKSKKKDENNYKKKAIKRKKTRPILKRGKSKPKETKTRKRAGPLFSAFDYFDPVTWELPESCLVEFDPVLEKLEEIFPDRNPKEIRSALRRINNLIKSGLQDPSHAIQRIEKRVKKRTTFSYTAILRDQMELNDDSAKDARELLFAVKYFSILALALIGQAFFSVGSLKEGPIDEERQQINQQQAKAAMEAAGFAETLRSRAELKRHKTTHAQKGEKAANARWARLHALRAKAIEIYCEKFAHLSNAKAAWEIWPLIEPGNVYIGRDRVERIVLPGEFPQKTVERWIGRYKKEVEKRKRH